MKKIILPIIVLILILIFSSCIPKQLMPEGDIMIKVITTEDVYEWEEKDDLPQKYYSVYSNGVYKETEIFTPDEVTEYYIDTGKTFTNEIVGNKIVNKVTKPTILDKNEIPVTPDDSILDIINAVAKSINHDISKLELIKDKDKYFAFVWLNVNWHSPCELYEYNFVDKTLHQICEWEEVDIVGIAVPDN